MRIKDVMNTYLFTLNEEDTLSDASEIMNLERIRHIPIVDKKYILKGLITHRNLIAALAEKSGAVKIKDIMIKEVKAIGPETPLKGAIDMMIVNKFGCLPVVENNRKLIGIVTEIDLLKILYETVQMPKDFYEGSINS